MARNRLRLLVDRIIEIAADDIPFGNRGYMIDNKGGVTPIDHMFGHESFVRNYSNQHLSVMEFVANKGWVLFERDGAFASMVYCRETITKEALAPAVRIINSWYKSFDITISEYVKADDQEIPVLKNATNRLASQFLIKLKVSL